ncbi:MAG: hypothetical protein KJP13_06845, partial [Altererythrobacter sp.]|nr:hypothetical protein [Altererythrobacter sp.]
MTLTSGLTRIKFSMAACAVGALLAMAPGTDALAFDEAEKEEIGKIVRDYLLNNPEIMIEVQQALEAKQEA